MIREPCQHCLGTGFVQDNRKLGEQAANSRKVTGVSQKQIADHMGISVSYLSDLERGRRDWNWELWTAMRKACLVAKKGTI